MIPRRQLQWRRLNENVYNLCGSLFDCTRHSSQAVNHPAASANQNVIISILREKWEEWPPCSAHTLKLLNRAKDWLIPNKTLKTGNGALSSMTRNYQLKSIRQSTQLSTHHWPPIFQAFLYGTNLFRTHTHTHTHTHARTHARTHTRTHARTRARTHTRFCIGIHSLLDQQIASPLHIL